MKGFIEVTVAAEGLETLSVKQLVNVNDIQVVMDISEMSVSDRKNLGVSQRASCIIVATGVADVPADIEETYEQVKQLIAEAM